MREIVDDVNIEQIRYAQNGQASSSMLKPGEGKQAPPITPLNSAVTKSREAILDAKPVTPKQRENLILREIEGHIRRFTFDNHLEPKYINTKLVREFGPRRLMRMSQLERLLAHNKKAYPLVKCTKRPKVQSHVEYVDPSSFDTDFMKGIPTPNCGTKQKRYQN